VKKTENFNAIISVTALQTYVFFDILDQGVVNSIDMVLILKSEKKVGGLHRTENFFFGIDRKSFAALRFAHKGINWFFSY
jgi:hypothetical protein